MTCNDCNTGMLVDLSTPLAPSTTSVKQNKTLATKSSTLTCCADSHTDSSQRQCLKETQNIQCETGVLVVIDSPNEKIYRRRKKPSAKDHRTINEGMTEEILSCGGDKGSSPWLLDDSCPDLIEEMFNFSNSTSLVITPSIRKIDSFTSRPNHSCTLSFAPLAVAASNNNNDVFLSAQESAELFEQANTVAVRISLAAKKLPRETRQGGVADADSNDNTETAFDKTPPHQALVIDPMGSFSTAATSTPIGSGDTLPGGRLGDHGGGLQDVSSCSSVVEGNLNQVAGKLFVKPASVVGPANKASGGIAMSRMTRRSVQAPLVSNYRKNEGNASICSATTSRNSRPPLAIATRRAPSVGGFGGLVPGLIHNRSACSTSSIGSAASNSVMSDKDTTSQASAAVPPSARFARAGSLLAPRTKQVRPTLIVSRLKPMQPSVSKATSEDTSAADSHAVAAHPRLSGKPGVAPTGRGTPKKTMRVSTSSNDLYGDCATASRVGHKSVIAPSLSKTTGLVKPEANLRELSKVRTTTTTGNKPKLELAAAEKGRGRLAAASSTANSKLSIKTLPPSGRR